LNNILKLLFINTQAWSPIRLRNYKVSSQIRA